jgi:hypothetical protein
MCIDSRVNGTLGEKPDGVGEDRIGDQDFIVDLNKDSGVTHPEYRKAHAVPNGRCNRMNNRLRWFTELTDRA